MNGNCWWILILVLILCCGCGSNCGNFGGSVFSNNGGGCGGNCGCDGCGCGGC